MKVGGEKGKAKRFITRRDEERHRCARMSERVGQLFGTINGI